MPAAAELNHLDREMTPSKSDSPPETIVSCEECQQPLRTAPARVCTPIRGAKRRGGHRANSDDRSMAQDDTDTTPLAPCRHGSSPIVRADAIDLAAHSEDGGSTSTPSGNSPATDGRETAERIAWMSDIRLSTRPTPKAQRETIVLSYFGGLTQSQIATRVDTPLGTIKSRTTSGLQRLADLIGRTDPRLGAHPYPATHAWACPMVPRAGQRRHRTQFAVSGGGARGMTERSRGGSVCAPAAPPGCTAPTRITDQVSSLS